VNRSIEELKRVLRGKYRIVRPLGRGGMGEVWLAQDEQLHCLVAVKVLGETLSRDAGFRARFEEEMTTQAKLRHPRIARPMNAGSLPGGQLYLVMEFVRGRTLRAILDEHQKAGTVMDPVTAAFDAYQALTGLWEAHHARVVHGDVKPENMMIGGEDEGEERNLTLLDFGLAKVLEVSGPPHRGAGPASRKTKKKSAAEDGGDTSMRLGTPRYLAPERIAHGQYDARSDLYSLGVVLAKSLTGADPFDFGDGDEEAILEAHLHQAPAPRWGRTPDCSDELQAITMRLLAKDPRDRFQSAREARDELSAVLRGSVPPGSMMAERLMAERKEWKLREVVEERKAPPSRRPPAPIAAAPRRQPDAPAAAARRQPDAPDVTRPLGSTAVARLRTPLLPPPMEEAPAADLTRPLTAEEKAAPFPVPTAPRVARSAPPVADVTRPLTAEEKAAWAPAPTASRGLRRAAASSSGWHEWVGEPVVDVTKLIAASERPPAMNAPFPLAPARAAGGHEWSGAPVADVTKPTARIGVNAETERRARWVAGVGAAALLVVGLAWMGLLVMEARAGGGGSAPAAGCARGAQARAGGAAAAARDAGREAGGPRR
jgi:serine/threonine protein kinase